MTDITPSSTSNSPLPQAPNLPDERPVRVRQRARAFVPRREPQPAVVASTAVEPTATVGEPLPFRVRVRQRPVAEPFTKPSATAGIPAGVAKFTGSKQLLSVIV